MRPEKERVACALLVLMHMFTDQNVVNYLKKTSNLISHTAALGFAVLPLDVACRGCTALFLSSQLRLRPRRGRVAESASRYVSCVFLLAFRFPAGKSGNHYKKAPIERRLRCRFRYLLRQTQLSWFCVGHTGLLGSQHPLINGIKACPSILVGFRVTRITCRAYISTAFYLSPYPSLPPVVQVVS